MTELPQATSRRERRERERAAEAADDRPRRNGPRRETPSRALRPERVAAEPGSRGRAIGRRVLSGAAMLFVGALAIGLSVPSSLFASSADAATGSSATASNSTGSSAAGSSAAGSSAAVVAQSAVVADDQTVSATTPDGFAVMTWAQLLAQKYSHVDSYQYTGGDGSIRWPFPYAVPISSPYGPRIAPCGGCSTFHNGVDFTPGEGAAIFAIADGVVTGREDGTSEYGNFVIITHQIGGHSVTSTYAHMLAGSSAITLGQTVKVGDFLGLVGMTGEATGPHLHFEIAVDGVRTDPIPWLEANVD